MKVALVTGASRGLGAIIAQKLAEAGLAVAVNYSSDKDGATKVVDNILAGGGSAYAARFSVIDNQAFDLGRGRNWRHARPHRPDC